MGCGGRRGGGGGGGWGGERSAAELSLTKLWTRASNYGPQKARAHIGQDSTPRSLTLLLDYKRSRHNKETGVGGGVQKSS